jgi:hypothetical protein
MRQISSKARHPRLFKPRMLRMDERRSCYHTVSCISFLEESIQQGLLLDRVTKSHLSIPIMAHVVQLIICLRIRI